MESFLCNQNDMPFSERFGLVIFICLHKNFFLILFSVKVVTNLSLGFPHSSSAQFLSYTEN